MKSSLKKIVYATVLRQQHPAAEATFSDYRLIKAYLNLRTLVIRHIKDVVLIAMGIGSAAFGLEAFLLPSNIIDGGATGMALLGTEIFKIPLAWLLVGINIPFVLLGYKTIGRQFAIKTILAIFTLAVVLSVVHFPIITNDKLLVAVFGGFCLGAGIGLSVRGGAVLDGTEVLAIFLSRKLSTTIGDIIIIINILIFSLAAYFLSIEAAMYSLITYLSAAKTMDFVIEGIEEYIGVTIISVKHKEIRDMIINKLGRGVTVSPSNYGYGRSGNAKVTDVLYSVVTRLEVSRLNSEIALIDKDAFVIMNALKDIKGGMIKKRPLAH